MIRSPSILCEWYCEKEIRPQLLQDPYKAHNSRSGTSWAQIYQIPICTCASPGSFTLKSIFTFPLLIALSQRGLDLILCFPDSYISWFQMSPANGRQEIRGWGREKPAFSPYRSLGQHLWQKLHSQHSSSSHLAQCAMVSAPPRWLQL